MAKTSARRKVASRRHRATDMAHVEHSDLSERNLPMLARSMTFSRMLRTNVKALRGLSHLQWLFPATCQRKNQAGLTEVEAARYLCAFEMINADGTLGQLVDIHEGMHMQHTNARLLPWHRVFLHLFEEALHTTGSSQ
jgi:hypothetical protein